jgi:hypothetical protein
MSRSTGRIIARELGPRTLLLPFSPLRAEFIVGNRIGSVEGSDGHECMGYVHNTKLSQIAESTEFIGSTAQTLYDTTKCIVHYATINGVKTKVISARCTAMGNNRITLDFDLFDKNYYIIMRISNE